MNAKKRILITGANGFVGSHLSRFLSSRNYEVTATDIWGDNLDFKGDLLNEKFVAELFQKKHYNFVIHAAALVPLTDKQDEFKSVNAYSAALIAKYARDAKVEFFLLISSSAPYGKPLDFPIGKTTAVSPIEPYGESKYLAELQTLKAWGEDSTVSIIRPRTIVGKGRLGIFEILFRWANLNYIIPLPKGGRHVLQLVHIQDLCRLIEEILRNRMSGLWPAGTDKYMLLNEDLIATFRAFGSRSRILSVPPLLFKLIAKLMKKIRLSPFTAWHYETLDLNFAFDNKWRPANFEYLYSNLDCLIGAYESYLMDSESKGESAHTKKWPTKGLDRIILLLTFVLTPFLRNRND